MPFEIRPTHKPCSAPAVRVDIDAFRTPSQFCDASDMRKIKNSVICLLSGSLKDSTDGTLLLGLARRGYNLPNFEEIDETAAEVIKIS